MRHLSGSGLVLAALLTCAQAARADPAETSFALTVNPLSGHHAVTGGRSDAVNFAPLPLAEIIVRSRNESVRIEGLVPVTLRYGSTGDGAQSTELSIANATYRHAFAGGWFVGAGQTLYNQSTTYANSNGTFYYRRGFIIDPIFGSEAQYSRVTGARFEAGRIVQGKRDRFEFWLAANPRMHGVQYTRIPTLLFFCASTIGAARGCPRAVHIYADPENAAQLDLTARIARRLSARSELLYGARYLNYTAHYDDFPGQLADRNVGWAPVVGYRVRL